MISNSWAPILCKNNEGGGNLKIDREQSIIYTKKHTVQYVLIVL